MRDYRYELHRELQPRDPGHVGDVLWIMLNPSTATDVDDDHTIRCVRRLTASIGGASFTVVNLFAARATRPRDLFGLSPEELQGPEGTRPLREALMGRTMAVAAWGVVPKPLQLARPPIEEWCWSLRIDLYCFGVTREGYPRHPSRLESAPPLRLYRMASAGPHVRLGPIEDTAPL